MFRVLVFCFLMICSLSALSEESNQSPLALTLKEAILLAIRENPNVQQAQLNVVQQKFALEVAQWQFQPHFQITSAESMNRIVNTNVRQTSKSWGAQPFASWLSPVGTQASLTWANNVTNQFNPSLSLQVVQPLLRGFGKAIVEASLYNAMDSEYISRLNVDNALRTTVTQVINAYLDVVSAANTVKIDKDALKRAEITVEQTKLFIKAGRKAGVELVAAQADVANAQTKLENDDNNLDQTRYALLTAIGIDPNTQVTFANIDVPDLIDKYSIPALEDAKRLTLENDIQYQVDQITLKGATKRSLLIAEDNTRVQLNLTGTATTGGGSGGGQNAGWSSLTNGANESQGLQLNLQIPIDDKSAEQAVVNAKISLREAETALKQEKWSKETNAINNWHTLYSTERSVHFAENAEMLQQKTYQIGFQKYSYGLIDSVELHTLQQQYVASQQELLASRINYLKALINLDQQIGRTLITWGIQPRYS